MTVKEQALEIFGRYFESWEKDSTRMENGYQYESTYDKMMQKVEKEILQLSVGKVPRGVNSKKKFKPNLGK